VLVAATLRDVAKLAGVSVSTASRALSGDRSRPVAAETQERIWEAVRQLNYEPNAAAQQLVHRVEGQVRRTYNVGLILGNVSYKFSDPFWSPVLDGVDNELIRKQYHLRFAFLVGDLKHGERRRLLSRTHVDGLILAGGVRPLGGALGASLSVMIEGDDTIRWQSPLRVDMIAMEKRRAMYQLVEHLASLGRRRIAFLGPSPTIDERAEAFPHAMARVDLPCPDEWRVLSPWTAEGAYPVAQALLAEHGRVIDALVCACDTIAIGAMRAAKECGMRLPDDLAITGFDDIHFARDLDPPLTTVHAPKELLGELGARRLLERIENPDLPPIVQMVPTTLVVRASCGAPADRAPQAGDGMEVSA
jgi:LacI family transcriptional regulator